MIRIIIVMKSNASTHMCIHITQTQTHTQADIFAGKHTVMHGLLLTLFTALMLAPFSSSSLTMSKWPLAAAKCRAVLRSWYQYDHWIIMNINS